MDSNLFHLLSLIMATCMGDLQATDIPWGGII
jgi:hypothetical protein